MDYAEHVAAVEREVTALVAALRAGPMDARVPTCPDWTVADLAQHVGEFEAFWTHVLCEATGTPKTPYPDVPDAGARADWCEELGRHLVDGLHATPAGAPAWTWAPEQSTNFIARRCANELAVHRFDAQSARGTPEPIDGDLAVDGIEEMFVMRDAWPDSPPGEGHTLHVHATDREAEWLLHMLPDGLDVRREHAKGDLALRGAISDLELVLYDRPPIGPVERLGDESVLDAWYRFFHFG